MSKNNGSATRMGSWQSTCSRIAGKRLNTIQLRRLVKTALAKLPRQAAQEIEAALFAGYATETISVSAANALTAEIMRICSDPALLSAAIR